MSRTRDLGIAIGLLAVAVSLVLAGTVFSSPFVWVLGVIAVVGVLPVSYKLVRYLPTRKASLGGVMHTLRGTRGSRFSGSRGMLVCFTGIDGSGKTTQAERVVAEFEDLGVPAMHVWARWRPFFSYPFMGVLYVVLGWRRKDYHKSSILKRIWGYLLLIDHSLFFLRYIYPGLLRGRVVCIDRYVVDQLVEMRYDGLYNERAARLLIRLLPTPSETFMMDVPAEEAVSRKDDTQEMLDRLHIDTDARSYLEERRALFHEVTDDLDVTLIDTTRPIEETHAEVADRVFESYFEF